MKLPREEMIAAWERRDPEYDGIFFFGVKTTGIFCRPSCPSRPQLENLEFFENINTAVGAGYRPCKRCKPELSMGNPPEWIATLMQRVADQPEGRFSAENLRKLGIAPERARRWFQAHYGMTFSAWCRGMRLSNAFTQIRNGASIDDVILGHGFDSHSGFRTAYTNMFRKPPGKTREEDCLRITMIKTPLGSMLAAASTGGVCQLEFADRRGLEKSYQEMRRRFDLPVVPGENAVLQQLRRELKEYFEGRRQKFTVPMVLAGTEFQKQAWTALAAIPYGKTASYEEIARRLGSLSAVRAVARANATNRLYLLVPCHRVIGKDGKLSGYGGGVWRKRLLLEFEKRGKKGSHFPLERTCNENVNCEQ